MTEDEVPTLYVQRRHATMVILPAKEEVLDIVAGVGKQILPVGRTSPNIVVAKPTVSPLETNLALVTSSGKVYSFVLRECSKDGRVADYKVYVDAPAKKVESAGPPPEVAELATCRTDLTGTKSLMDGFKSQLADMDQRLKGRVVPQEHGAEMVSDYHIPRHARSEPFLVESVMHDGAFTYVRTKAKERAALYDQKDGKADMVDFDLRHGVYIVPQVLDVFTLEIGKKKVEIKRANPQ